MIALKKRASTKGSIENHIGMPEMNQNLNDRLNA
jgi:hypothetical protein